jgi:RHS repeat-associated protein
MEPDPSIQNWYGGLVDGMRAASGQMYKRNRYYDPKTGQFTQPDPIGLAGGLNAYGFADGDPVTYGDPYGLSAESGCPPICNETNPRHLELEVERAENATAGDAALAVGVLGATLGAPLLSRAGAAILTRLGFGAARATPAAAAAGPAVFRNGERVQRFFETAQGRVEMLYRVNIQDRTLHLDGVSVFPHFAERLNPGSAAVQQGLRTLMSEARAQGFETLRITGERISGAGPGRIQDLVLNLKK